MPNKALKTGYFWIIYDCPFQVNSKFYFNRVHKTFFYRSLIESTFLSENH